MKSPLKADFSFYDHKTRRRDSGEHSGDGDHIRYFIKQFVHFLRRRKYCASKLFFYTLNTENDGCNSEVKQKRKRVDNRRDKRARHDSGVEADLLREKRKRTADEF